MKIIISTPSTGYIEAYLNEENPKTVKAFIEALPIKGKASLWGDEIYFTIPIDVPSENGKSVVE